MAAPGGNVPPLAPNPNVTPPVVANAVYLPATNWNLFKSLPNYDLRNGDVTEVTSIFMKATIPSVYHWIPITGLAPSDAVYAIDGYIKSHLERLTATPPTNWTVDQIRKAAICLGVARAVSTTYYRITDNDLIAGEKVPAMLSANITPEKEVRYTVAAGVSAAANTRLSETLTLSETEQAVICELVKCSMGIIPMQGYSLMMTGHHYLGQGETQAKRVYTVVEKAHWKHTDVAKWFSDDTEILRDVLWHKACHPVNISVKEAAAMDAQVASKLKAAGAGACASRLPAIESELRTANSYLTLLATVTPSFEMFAGSVDVSALTAMVAVVKSLPVKVLNPEVPDEIKQGYGGLVTNRDTALKMLDAMLKRNQDRVAWCYGFYIAQAESNAMAGSGMGGGEDTLRTSYSLKKLRSNSPCAWNSGYLNYGDFLAMMNKRRAEGTYQGPGITIA